MVCLDETSKQPAVAETHAPVAMQPGLPARVDYEYARNGVANQFMMFAPLERLRHVKVTDRRTAVDYAHVLKDLADVHFAQAETIVLIQDNLNTHAAASLYEAFSRPRGQATSSSASNGITRRNTQFLAGLGRIRTRRPRLHNALTGASPTNGQSSTRSTPGSASETKPTPSLSGTSQRTMPGSS